MGNICLYDEAFTKREMREETGRCGICKIAECDYSSVSRIPVRRGEWEDGHSVAFCSVCGEQSEWKTPYCPYCGAKME